MKKILLILCLFLSIDLSAQTPLRMGVMTDLHYLSEELMEEGDALSNYVNNGGKNVRVVPEVLEQVFEAYAKDSLDVLLITGDLTNDGERQSHLDLIAKLKNLQERGTKVFVIPGNHDINVPSPKAYQKDMITSVENVSPQEFAKIYGNCGYNSALSRDTASLSYLTELSENVWMLAIDAARYDEYTTYTISAGRIKPETERWMNSMFAQAKKEGKQLVAMMHWGVTPHNEFQESFFPAYLVDNWRHIADLLADNHINLVFTGHFHANDITRFPCSNGSDLYDVETGALVSFPFTYRFVNLYTDRAEITTQVVESTLSYPFLREEDKNRMRHIATQTAKQKLNMMGFNLADSIVEPLSKLVAEFFLMHLAGDEVMTEEIENKLGVFSNLLDLESVLNIESLDYEPTDSNVTIYF